MYLGEFLGCQDYFGGHLQIKGIDVKILVGI